MNIFIIKYFTQNEGKTNFMTNSSSLSRHITPEASPEVTYNIYITEPRITQKICSSDM